MAKTSVIFIAHVFLESKVIPAAAPRCVDSRLTSDREEKWLLTHAKRVSKHRSSMSSAGTQTKKQRTLPSTTPRGRIGPPQHLTHTFNARPELAIARTKPPSQSSMPRRHNPAVVKNLIDLTLDDDEDPHAVLHRANGPVVETPRTEAQRPKLQTYPQSISSATSTGSSCKSKNWLDLCVKCKRSGVPLIDVLIQCQQCRLHYHTQCHAPKIECVAWKP